MRHKLIWILPNDDFNHLRYLLNKRFGVPLDGLEEIKALIPLEKLLKIFKDFHLYDFELIIKEEAIKNETNPSS